METNEKNDKWWFTNKDKVSKEDLDPYGEEDWETPSPPHSWREGIMGPPGRCGVSGVPDLWLYSNSGRTYGTSSNWYSNSGETYANSGGTYANCGGTYASSERRENQVTTAPTVFPYLTPEQIAEREWNNMPWWKKMFIKKPNT